MVDTPAAATRLGASTDGTPALVLRNGSLLLGGQAVLTGGQACAFTCAAARVEAVWRAWMWCE